jgi:rubrerythrin
MTYYSCEQCGELVNLSALEGKPRRQHCPVCEESTRWTPEFEADEGMF